VRDYLEARLEAAPPGNAVSWVPIFALIRLAITVADADALKVFGHIEIKLRRVTTVR